MYFRKHSKVQSLSEPRKLDENEKLETEEGRKKAQSLFSKKFMDYLSSKKSKGSTESPGTRDLREWGKDQNESSDETSASDSSKKTHKKFRKRAKNLSPSPTLTIDHTWRSKLTQCNLIKEPEEIVISDELKPFLMNMSVLLQELKQTWNDLPESEIVYSLLSKITILVTEFSRRPLKDMEAEIKGESFMSLEKTMQAIMNLIEEHKKNASLDLDTGIREYKKIERDIAAKVQMIDENRKFLEMEEEESKPNLAETDIELRVKNSILFNERLKARIKFNQTRIKRYKKILVEKEWTKHKLENDLAHVKKKMSKIDLIDNPEIHDKSIPFPDSSSKGHINRTDSKKSQSQSLNLKKDKVKTSKNSERP